MSKTAVVGCFSAPAFLAYAAPESKVLGYSVWREYNAYYFYPDPSDLTTYVPVRAGFLSDGASVPRPFWWLIPPWGRYGQAAVTHDHLCETGTMVVKGQVTTLTDRSQVDKLFKEAMIASGVSAWKRNLMYISVRVYAVLTKAKVPSPDPVLERLITTWNPNYSIGASGSTV
jgi:hypothetical protein